jgi:hypothetical protein
MIMITKKISGYLDYIKLGIKRCSMIIEESSVTAEFSSNAYHMSV